MTTASSYPRLSSYGWLSIHTKRWLSRQRQYIVSPSPRGTAAARLSEFQDVWTELTQADRAWFAETLTELLVDACQEERAYKTGTPRVGLGSRGAGEGGGHTPAGGSVADNDKRPGPTGIDRGADG